MLEWLKRHAWKACILQKGIPSSNLGLSAKIGSAGTRRADFFFCYPNVTPVYMFFFQNKSSNVITLLNTPEYSLRFKPKVVTRVGWITCFFGKCSISRFVRDNMVL